MVRVDAQRALEGEPRHRQVAKLRRLVTGFRRWSTSHCLNVMYVTGLLVACTLVSIEQRGFAVAGVDTARRACAGILLRQFPD